MPARRSRNNLVWIDLETTGLDPDRHVIVEIATIVTDRDLNVLAEGRDLVIRQPASVWEGVDAWVAEQHGGSGLIRASKASVVSLAEAEERTLERVKSHCPPKLCPLAGSSVCFDRRFLIRHMPKLNAYLHYRNVDVSTVKELVRRWNPHMVEKVEKASKHRALDDIRESIEELRLYRRVAFREAE
jgi:oligoribonuclease